MKVNKLLGVFSISTYWFALFYSWQNTKTVFGDNRFISRIGFNESCKRLHWSKEHFWQWQPDDSRLTIVMISRVHLDSQCIILLLCQMSNTFWLNLNKQIWPMCEMGEQLVLWSSTSLQIAASNMDLLYWWTHSMRTFLHLRLHAK